MATSSPFSRSALPTPHFLNTPTSPSQNYLDNLNEEHALQFTGLVRIRDEKQQPTQIPTQTKHTTTTTTQHSTSPLPNAEKPSSPPPPANRTTDMARFTTESLHSYQFSPSVTPHLMQIRKNLLWRSVEYMRMKLTPSPSNQASSNAHTTEPPTEKGNNKEKEKWKFTKDATAESPKDKEVKIGPIINATSELDISDSDEITSIERSKKKSDSRKSDFDEIKETPKLSEKPHIVIPVQPGPSSKTEAIIGPIRIQTANLPSSRDEDTTEGSGSGENYLNSAGIPHSALHSPHRFSARQIQSLFSTDKNGTILLTNKMVYSTFGYDGSELVGKNILHLIAPSYREKLRRKLSIEVAEGVEKNGSDEQMTDVVIHCGKVLEICAKDGSFNTVSLWLKAKMAPTGMLNYVWVFQDIAESRATIEISQEGKIVTTSGSFLKIFGISPTAVAGTSIAALIPSLKTHLVESDAGQSHVELDEDMSPWTVRAGENLSSRKYVTLRVSESVHLPSCIRARRTDLSSDSDPKDTTGSSVAEDAKWYTVDVVALEFIGGMIVVGSDGEIISGNGACLKRLLGYTRHDVGLKIKNIAQLIPQFPRLLELLQREKDFAKKNAGSTTTSPYRSPIVGTSYLRKRTLPPAAISEEHDGGADSSGSSNNRPSFPTAVSVHSPPIGRPTAISPYSALPPSLGEIVILHKDGNPIKIDVQIREVSQGSSTVYAVWLSYDRTEKNLDSFQESKAAPSVAAELPTETVKTPSPPRPLSAVLDNIKAHANDRLLGGRTPCPIDQPMEPVTVLLEAPNEASATPVTMLAGAVPKDIEDYLLLDPMGEGAYGTARLAVRISDESSVLKFIVKGRILVESWTKDPEIGVVPMEIGILHRLSKFPHPNIVQMTHFFSDALHYYLEMDLFGSGMDLFDYIEVKKDDLPEAEIKRIFQQTCSAVEHLHKHGIVHRDIKDENIIINENGQVRLIDFGSSAYVRAGRPFEIFCGTLDYAAPEILHGFKYAGKPQDVWALGILLYTLIYKENPFYNIDEIVAGSLRLPFVLSDDSVLLIRKILNRDVAKRLTMEDIVNDPWFDGVKEEVDFLSLHIPTS